MPSRIAAELMIRWNIQIANVPGAVRYSQRGNWYHALTRFPGVLLDATGYVVFESERAWRECPLLHIGPKGDVGVPGGIRIIYGYREMESNHELDM